MVVDSIVAMLAETAQFKGRDLMVGHYAELFGGTGSSQTPEV